MWTFKVVRDRVTGEYITRFYAQGKLCVSADYFTTDRTDALATGRSECARLNAVANPERLVKQIMALDDALKPWTREVV